MELLNQYNQTQNNNNSYWEDEDSFTYSSDSPIHSDSPIQPVNNQNHTSGWSQEWSSEYVSPTYIPTSSIPSQVSIPRPSTPRPSTPRPSTPRRKNVHVPRKLFFDDDHKPNVNINPKLIPFIMLLLVGIVTCLLTVIDTNNIIIEPSYPSFSFSRRTDWREKYTNECCKLGKLETTGIHRLNDCQGGGRCGIYLNNWLEDVGENPANTTWTKDCCYHFKPMTVTRVKTYCSLSCLNSQ